MGKRPQVSVIMATFNPDDHIIESIQSILNQSFTDFELIIIDDSVEEWSKKFLSFNDKRIRYVHNEKKLGLASSLNKAISMASGDYIARMDADDISHKDRLKYQVSFLKKNADVDIVGSWAYFINDKNLIVNGWGKEITDEEIKWKMMFNVPFMHPSIMVRTDVIRRYMYTDGMPYAEDYDLWTRMIGTCIFYNIPRRLIKYRVSPNGLTSLQVRDGLDEEKHNKQLKIIKKCYDRVIRYHGAEELMELDGYVDMLYGKRLDNFSFRSRKHFVLNLYKLLKERMGMRKALYYTSYLWLKISKQYFLSIPSTIIRISSIAVIVELAINKAFAIISGIAANNRRVYNWVLR